MVHYVFPCRNGGSPRRQTQHNGTAGLVNGPANGFNLGLLHRVIRTRNVIYFNVVDTPLRVHPNDGAVIGPAFRFGGIHAIHVGVPGAGGIYERNIGRPDAGTQDGRVFFNRLTGNTAHDMYAEFQPF